MHSLLAFLCLFSLWPKGAGASDPNLPLMDYLDQNHLVCLKWGFDNPEGHITLKLIVNTTGWVSFGLSPNGGMAGSDIVIGGVESGGNYFTDRHATGNTMPVVDAQQSYTLLSMEESEGQTIMTVRRSILSCDDQDVTITDQPIKVIYAYGTTDVIAYHGAHRGTKEINLLNFMPKTITNNSNFIDTRMDNLLVPPIPTYYHCKVMKFPTLPTKHHIYQIEPVIEHVDFVHHLLLYQCPIFVTAPYDRPCYMGDIGDVCVRVLAVWGVGGGVFELPENAGFPIGGPGSDTLYRLEIHYNNPNREEGRIDSSGLRLHYTDQLRQHDAGTLTTGLALLLLPFDYNIPPAADEFRTYGVCNTTLFPQFVNPVPELQVFAVILHTHLAGRKVRVAHYRGGEQIGFLAVNENYDFNIQQIVNSGSIKNIKPGDEIVVECTYSTTNRTKATKMGLETTEEMCLAFLLYYPEINIGLCVSHPNTSMSATTSASGQDEIAEQETYLKTIPQVQFVSDKNFQHAIIPNGTVREMMKTPKVTCNNAPSELDTSWIVSPAGLMLLLLWMAIM